MTDESNIIAILLSAAGTIGGFILGAWGLRWVGRRNDARQALIAVAALFTGYALCGVSGIILCIQIGRL